MREMSDQSPGNRIQLAPGVWAPADGLTFTFSSSSGPGGQNVNKRATRAELRLRIDALPIPADAKDRLAAFAGQRATSAGELIIAADEHRSQSRNKAEALARLRELLVRAMVRPKKRRPTRPGRGAVERRLEAKRREGDRKRTRRSGGDD
ncbi:MAG: alternative ribosome rescue aminoacyl-tRNA hydrolase ArfB [Phycisphaerales bacterium]